MHFPQLQILLGLAATAAAIDTRLHVGGGCSGNSIVCLNANPNVCCNGSPQPIFLSVGFYGIPEFWNLECRGHGGGGCNNIKEIQTAQGTNFVCLRNGGFSGAGYGFRGKKRAAADEAQECPATQTCSGSQKPDFLELEDGGKYNLAVMDEAPLARMVRVPRTRLLLLSIAASGANTSEIPEEFDAFKME